MKGVVYKSTGSWYVVKGDDQQFYNARIKGIFKIDGITSTNPIAVGDEVEISTEDNDTMIVEIYPRRNYINRKSPSNRHQHHIIAANVDQTLLFATLKNPKTSNGFIDRFLVTAEAYHVPAILVFNKIDLYKEKELALLSHLTKLYLKIGYQVYHTSIETKAGVDDLIEALKGKTTLVSGHSGVGKSSFLNLLDNELSLKTLEVSGWSGKGMHSTTFAEMYDIDQDIKVIDTPGMREFALADIQKNELSHYFPEMKSYLQSCQFNNCLHINEPKCAVKAAVEAGEISEDRFFSYYSILESIEDKKWK